MGNYKVEKIIDGLRKKGFDMSTKEFIKTTLYRILKKYHIREQLDLDEYFELIKQLMDLHLLQLTRLNHAKE